MSSIAVKLPLMYDSDGGYQMLRTLASTAHQNLKMLILTEPGERIMIPEYGVGLKRYLFENSHSGIESDISSKIHQQVRRYMPYIKIRHIAFDQQEIDRGILQMRIHYSIPKLNHNSQLDIST
jgi:hypothetical protein